jgi:hypothetical protein
MLMELALKVTQMESKGSEGSSPEGQLEKH